MIVPLLSLGRYPVGRYKGSKSDSCMVNQIDRGNGLS